MENTQNITYAETAHTNIHGKCTKRNTRQNTQNKYAEKTRETDTYTCIFFKLRLRGLTSAPNAHPVMVWSSGLMTLKQPVRLLVVTQCFDTRFAVASHQVRLSINGLEVQTMSQAAPSSAPSWNPSAISSITWTRYNTTNMLRRSRRRLNSGAAVWEPVRVGKQARMASLAASAC
jgi:hypothetical protein